jgi:hypothetical protein
MIAASVISMSAIISSTANADSVWDEGAIGDFSNNGLVPTVLTFSLGSNRVIGTTGNPGTGIDRDYFSFSVPTGMALTSLMVLSNTSVSGSSSFIGIQAGPQLTVTPSGGGVENLIGFAHYGNDQVGTDLLPFFGIAGGLASGTYSVWVQELGGVVPYGFEFNVAAVPLPGAAWLLLSGIAGVASLRRRKIAR